MRFFTRAMLSGELADAEVDSRSKAYQQRIDSLMDALPKDIAELTRINLHDGLIRRVTVDNEAHLLSLVLRCGDLQVGYFDVDLHYSGITLTTQQLQVLSRRAHDRHTEILADEIDMAADGRFVHRLIFWPYDELEITFAGLTIQKRDQAGREVADDREPIIEIM